MAHGKRSGNWLVGMTGMVAAFLGNATPAAAQCIMCYGSAAGSGSRGIRALQIGILVLLIPTLTLLGSVLWLAYRRRSSHVAESEITGKDATWEEGLRALEVSQEPDSAVPRL